MSRMVELNLNPDKRTLRQFGFIAFLGFGILGYLASSEKLIFAYGLGNTRETVANLLWGIGAAAALFSVTFPRANWPIYVGLSLASFPIGFVLSYVILGTLFFLVITPVAIVFRVVGRDSMHRKFDPTASSYWCSIQRAQTKESYFRQY